MFPAAPNYLRTKIAQCPACAGRAKMAGSESNARCVRGTPRLPALCAKASFQELSSLSKEKQQSRHRTHSLGSGRASRDHGRPCVGRRGRCSPRDARVPRSAREVERRLQCAERALGSAGRLHVGDAVRIEGLETAPLCADVGIARARVSHGVPRWVSGGASGAGRGGAEGDEVELSGAGCGVRRGGAKRGGVGRYASLGLRRAACV